VVGAGGYDELTITDAILNQLPQRQQNPHLSTWGAKIRNQGVIYSRINREKVNKNNN